MSEEKEKKKTENVREEKYLTFPLQNEEFGVAIKNVTEIVGIQSITEVPGLEHFIKGVINLRGDIVPVIDVRLRFGMEEKEYNDRTCIIVVNLQNLNIGLLVDTVSEVVSIKETQIEPPPKIATKGNSQYMEGIGKIDKRVIILLDLDKLTYREAFERLKEDMLA